MVDLMKQQQSLTQGEIDMNPLEKYKNIDILLAKYGIKSIDEAKDICKKSKIDVEKIVKGVQPICFENAVNAYQVGVAICIKSGEKKAPMAALKLGEALQAFCVPGSVADLRQIGIGHGRLAARLLDEKTKSFCFLAGHESFAAAEGAIGIVNNANKVRQSPLNIILNGLGKDAGYIIARINGFTYVQTSFNHTTGKLKVVKTIPFSNTEKAKIKVYGAFDVPEGVAIMQLEKVDVSITGNSTNPVRFQIPVAGIYKKWCTEHGRDYFSVASGGGTGRTLHPDNMRCGPASYGLTDTMGRMHCDVQFAGSSSVPAHVAMMGFIGMGNNPIVGATVALSVAVATNKG